MSKAKLLALRVIFCVFAASMTTTHANATVILEVSAGQLTGARNVNVNGTLYDVSFSDGTCVGLFDGCDAVTDFLFSTVETATAAGQALLDQVFVDGPDGSFDTNPRLTSGCERSLCATLIPYEPLSSGRLLIAEVRNFLSVSADSIRLVNFANTTFDTGGRSGDTFAVFTASSGTTAEIPEPATLMLFGLGLIGLVGGIKLQHKRNRQTPAPTSI